MILALQLQFSLSLTISPAITSSVREYKAPLVYYGVNAVFMTGHTVFGALSCVKGKLLFLKIYTAVGEKYFRLQYLLLIRILEGGRVQALNLVYYF